MFDSFWSIILWSLYFFFVVAFLMLLFRIFADLFTDKSASGWAKVGWTLLLLFFPLLGVLIYLIARGKSMGERAMAQAAEMQSAQEKYIQDVAAKSATPAEQIKHAKDLLDSGAISQAEFDQLKAKALG